MSGCVARRPLGTTANLPAWHHVAMSQSILARPAPPAGVRIPYGDGPLQFGDLRLPDGDGPHPCVIAIHGGFWQSLYTLDHLGHFCAALTAAGLATWSVEYRRISDEGGGWPGTFLDVAAGASHLFAIAADHRLDTTRVSITGHSAGGQLAAWLAGIDAAPGSPELRIDPLPLAGVVSLAGVLDLRAASEEGVGSGTVEQVMGGTPDQVPDRYDNASPIGFMPFPVPHLGIHGGMDSNVPLSMSERFHLHAKENGSESSLLVLPGIGHFELIDPRSEIFPQVRDAIVRMTG